MSLSTRRDVTSIRNHCPMGDERLDWHLTYRNGIAQTLCRIGHSRIMREPGVGLIGFSCGRNSALHFTRNTGFQATNKRCWCTVSSANIKRTKHNDAEALIAVPQAVSLCLRWCSFGCQTTTFSCDRHAKTKRRRHLLFAVTGSFYSLLAFELQRPHIDALELQLYRTVSL